MTIRNHLQILVLQSTALSLQKLKIAICAFDLLREKGGFAISQQYVLYTLIYNTKKASLSKLFTLYKKATINSYRKALCRKLLFFFFFSYCEKSYNTILSGSTINTEHTTQTHVGSDLDMWQKRIRQNFNTFFFCIAVKTLYKSPIQAFLLTILRKVLYTFQVSFAKKGHKACLGCAQLLLKLIRGGQWSGLIITY